MIDGCLTEGEDTVDDKQLNTFQALQNEALSNAELKVRNWSQVTV